MTSHIATIRTAVPAEHAAIEALQWRASIANEHDRAALLAHPEVVTTPVEHLVQGNAFVATVGTILCGFAVAIPRVDGDFELDAIFVDPDHRRVGIGRQLLDSCITHATAHGARNLHVIGNRHASIFYDRTGFRRIGTVKTQLGSGDLMVLAFGTQPSK